MQRALTRRRPRSSARRSRRCRTRRVPPTSPTSRAAAPATSVASPAGLTASRRAPWAAAAMGNASVRAAGANAMRATAARRARRRCARTTARAAASATTAHARAMPASRVPTAPCWTVATVCSIPRRATSTARMAGRAGNATRRHAQTDATATATASRCARDAHHPTHFRTRSMSRLPLALPPPCLVA